MTFENPAYAFATAVVDELVRGGVRHLCLCPGSRSTPVALAAADHATLRVWTLIDERSAGFFAVGMAKALRAPVALLSTSGTAAANFLPSVVEARYGRVPLVVVTADRPYELRDSGAPQTIDQVRLYGPHAKWFADVPPPGASEALMRHARAMTCRALAVATNEPAGPVHINVQFREPLVPLGDPLPPADPASRTARPDGTPYVRVVRSHRCLEAGCVEVVARELRERARGVIVCGPQDHPDFPTAVAALARRIGYPVLADPLSQVRCGPHDRTVVVDAYDAMLRSDEVGQLLAPDVVIRFGATPTSRPLLGYLARHAGARQILVDVAGEAHDPDHVAADVVQADARLFCEALRDALGEREDRGWIDAWRRAAAAARRALRAYVAGLDEPFEGAVFEDLAEVLPDGALLYVGNSMPVRDADAYFGGRSAAVRFLGNRGASGIDGLISSALGAAAVSDGPVVLVVGDLSFYHDMNGLLAARLYGLSSTIVLVNNDGGGIFSFLPQAAHPEHFERLFGTPHGLDFRPAVQMYGGTHTRPDGSRAFRRAVRNALEEGGLQVIEVRTDRQRNVVLHRAAQGAATAAVLAELRAGES
ncbi:MAG: 2-succinyl-5-enolpyruvyl-6-hydroxy-3-cyclohexene-1-carboxylic-acid synthase [Armatimonadota bacterium]|nr:2-succinyl-5-enolpyruvyl-6-hydroxy-3-cyclohexene-1-carboxylic-acid synthase [Armatimonadota bacterium]MDR5696887.1 2-succinyl-5-enolpyruvyl-6-hydroxy-3-cyclohexene-1-carboxylic-acid synthase [Armatimonadota bacterium]